LCKNTWSYNQGVIIGGLVELQKALPHPDSPYLVFASQIAHAALATLSDSNGIIHDVCEPDCGADGTQFKGIFMRNLQLLHEVAPDSAFADAVQRNAESIWEKNRADGGTIFSVIWSGPYVRPGNASTHSSAMDALVAALTVVRSDSLDTEKMEL
jgi:predicted alpha-1,6-mannanase (GH76 family)